MVLQDPSRYSILIADDEREWRDVLQEVFLKEGFRTEVAQNGEEALEILLQRCVHLLLFDMHMGRLSGLDTFLIVRQRNVLVPCILLTADISERLIRDALAVRVYKVLAKPVSRQVLVHAVAEALARTYGPGMP
ncbi:MAG: response regulator [Gemmataceae bacterium]